MDHSEVIKSGDQNDQERDFRRAPEFDYRVRGLYVARFGLTASAPSLRTLSAS